MKAETSSLIINAVAEAKPGDYVCQFCKKGFVRESTLSAHHCEPKRRSQQRTEVGVNLGYQAWIRFYELTQGSAKLKNYDDFCQSQYYSAFVKFGRHCHGIEAINFGRFIDFVIKNNIKLDHWCRENIYDKYLLELLCSEAAEDALTRSIEYMQNWSDDNQTSCCDFFKLISTNRLVASIRNGRISAWCLYCCASGNAALSSLNQEQVLLIWSFINTDFWQKKLRDYPADTEMVKYVLEQAGF